MPARLDHVTLVTADFERAVAFYDAVLAPLGLDRVAEFGDEEVDGASPEAIAWGDSAEPTTVLWVVVGDTATSNAVIRLQVPDRAQVEQFHRAALSAGGRSRARPRRWAIYRSGEFSAAVLDPDGNVVEAVSPE